MFIYITAYKNFMMNHSHYYKILYEYKILKVNFFKLCSLNLIFYYNENIYNDLLKSICFIYNLFMFYILCNMCLNVVINVKYIKKINDFKKYTKNHIYKNKLTINNYKI